jgi:hypothetical protein
LLLNEISLPAEQAATYKEEQQIVAVAATGCRRQAVGCQAIKESL